MLAVSPARLLFLVVVGIGVGGTALWSMVGRVHDTGVTKVVIDTDLHNSTSPAQLKVVTLNCWGLWLVSKRRDYRFRHIAQFLENTFADVVLLQEVFVRSDVDALTAAGARGNLPHAHRFHGGVLGGELLTLSRHPITAAFFSPYRTPGDALAVGHGDFYAGKGVGYCRITTSAGQAIDVYNTHTHANYGHKYQQLPGRSWKLPKDSDAAVRLANIVQLAEVVRLTGGQHIILAGDLNASPDTLEVAVLRAMLPHLKDAWGVLHPDQPGYTSNAPGNNLAMNSGDPPIRIDAILTTAEPVGCALLNGSCADGTSLSDHMGVQAVLSLGAPKQQQQLSPTVADSAAEAVQTALNIIRKGAERYRRWKLGLILASSLLMVVGLVAFGLVVASPWWGKFPDPLVPVLSAIQTAALVLAPLAFVIGMAAYSSIGNGLEGTHSELQRVLPQKH